MARVIASASAYVIAATKKVPKLNVKNAFVLRKRPNRAEEDLLEQEKNLREKEIVERFPSSEEMCGDLEMGLLMIDGCDLAYQRALRKNVSLFFGRTWSSRRVVYTKDVLIFSIPNGNTTDASESWFDAVPLFQIDKIHEMHASKQDRARRTKNQQPPTKPGNNSNQAVNESDENNNQDVPNDEALVENPEESGVEYGVEHYSNTLEVHTINEGYNAGRAYYLQVNDA